MAEIIKVLNVDVAKKNRFQALVAKQYDNKSRYLKVRLQNEGADIDVEASCTVVMNALRADGMSKGYAGTVNEDGTVTVPVTSWMLMLDDTVECDISVIDAMARKLTTMTFEIEVQAAAHGGNGIEEDENYDLLISLLSDVADATAGYQAAITDTEAATQRAEEASESAENAVQNLTDETQKAAEAGKAANDAATAANEAAEKATTAAEKAESASTAYDDSAERIEAAVTKAEAAAAQVEHLNASASEDAAAAAASAEAAAVSASTAASDRSAAESAAAAAESAAKSIGSALDDAAASAQESASFAATAEGASAAAAESAERAEELADSVDAGKVQAQLDAKADNLYFDTSTNLLYLTSGGEIISDGIRVATSGGGGGGGDAYYTASLTNLLDSRVFSVASEENAVLRFQYTSKNTEDNVDDGPGSGSVSVGGIKVLSFSAAQGANELDITRYLTAGTNSVRLSVENSEGTVRSLVYTVTVVTLQMTTTLDEMAVYTGDVTFYYTPTGEGDKTIHFVMDGVEIGTATVASTGRGQTFTIPAQSHGAHVFTAYAEVTNGNEVTRSNTIRLGMVFAEASNTAPIILLDLQQDSAQEGDNVTAKYLAYDPGGETAGIELTVTQDGESYSSQHLTVPRTAQSWVVNNLPGGEIVLKITCGSVSASRALSVEKSALVIEPATDSLALHFDPTGRSNAEGNPAAWSDGGVTASFSGVGFSGADGWLTDEDGAPLLRLLPGGNVTIPYQPFASDRRAGGATVEVEMATHNVRDYESVVLSCLSGGRGFKIASQYAEIKSEQSELSMQFKEDQKVRLSFVVEPQALHRLMYVYVDGVMCGAVQYPTDDNFAQSPAVGITIGAESSGIDIYRIRIYTRGLDRGEVLDNYVADLPTLSERTAAYRRNDLLDLAGDIQLTKLPSTLPYMVISCPELPQYKGDKKICSLTYVDPAEQERSFTAENVQIDVQGTSSAGYKKKNFKWKLQSGLIYTSSGEQSDTYQLRGGDSVPASVFCMKADVASSEGANNVELVRLYNDVCPYKLPAQKEDGRVRVGIDGKPCVIFWLNSDTGKATFWGKYNFNNDKSAAEVFGLTEGCESWEFRNNTSARVLFQSADFSDDGWQDDFEARYPDGSTDVTKLKALCEWVASTNRNAVTGDTDKASRLQKFKDEFEDHFVKEPMLFYYVFTETFLMVDNRAKNFFPTTYDGVHWLPLPYDFDTALGINNEGQLVFDYDLEDTDKVSGANVFNGQDSVLWNNLRDAFPEEITAMYTSLRSGSLFGYTSTISRFAEHQAVWPERVWNEDAWEKYLEPLENDNNASYLPMLQGDKASQRDWWAYNGFRYRDSKYQCGDASSKFITLRCYAAGDITVTPYSHIWPRIKYGSYTVTERGKRNQATTLACPLTKMDDTEVYIYSADRLAAIGDLKALQVGYADFTAATKLQSLKLGDGASGYSNPNLTGVDVGNNELLTALDVRNCPNLTTTVDLSGCVSLETVLASGSGIKSVTLPVGGKVKTLELPGSITNLTVREQKQIESFACAGYSNLTTLRVENSAGIPLSTVLSGATTLSRVRILGAALNFTDATELRRLAAAGGLDANGNNTDTAVLTGTCHIGTILNTELVRFRSLWPNLTITADEVQSIYTVTFQNWDGTQLYQTTCPKGENVADPVENGLIATPTRAGDANYTYTFKGWDKPLNNITADRTITAQYSTEVSVAVTFANWDGSTLYTMYLRSGGTVADPVALGLMETPSRTPEASYGYIFKGWDKDLYVTATENTTYTAQYSTDQQFTVTFYDWDGTTVLDTQTVLDGENAVDPVVYGRIATPTREQTAQYTYSWTGWSDSFTNITANKSVTATYSTTTRTYTITFYNGTTAVQTVKGVAYGGSASYTGSDLTKPDVSNPENYLHIGWSPTPTSITGDTDCYAVYLEVPSGFDEAYGVLWAYENSSTKLNRLGAAKSFADPVPATSLTGSGSSPFDSIMPWAGMKKYNIIDGEIAYSEDDDGFSTTNYDTVVYIPEFWYKAQKDTNTKTWIWAISPTEKAGFAKHPGSGRYIGRYHSSGSSAGVYSKSGVVPLTSVSRTNYRAYSHNKGENWWMLDIATWSALQMLFLIEFANFDSQTKLGKGYGSSSQTCGKSDGAAYHTVNGGNTYNQYRWVEQPFGLAFDWVDGFVAYNKKCYLGTNNASFADSTSALTAAGVTLPSSGYIKGFGYSEQFPWAFLPDTSGGSSATFVPDYVYSRSGTYALYVGGYCGSSDNYGLFCFSAYYSASYTYSYLGSRLLYIP